MNMFPIDDIRIFDVCEGKKIPKNGRNLTFRQHIYDFSNDVRKGMRKQVNNDILMRANEWVMGETHDPIQVVQYQTTLRIRLDYRNEINGTSHSF